VFADPAGEPLDWPIVAVRDHRRNVHRDIPFRFGLKGKVLPKILCYQQSSSSTSHYICASK
jgi:hypothetical protein